MSPPENKDKKSKKSITIVGKKQANKGYVFVYSGPMSECKNCKVKNICFGLTPGQTYVVSEVREKQHSCDVFADVGQVVEVEISPKNVAVDEKKAIAGSVVTLKHTKCNIMSCPHYKTCTNISLRTGDKLKIVSVGKKIDCPEGRIVVEVLPAE